MSAPEDVEALLAEHEDWMYPNGISGIVSCVCGLDLGERGFGGRNVPVAHRAHVAAVLDAYVVEKQRGAVEAATRKWQTGGWAVLIETLNNVGAGIPALAAGQAVTEWWRDYAATTYPTPKETP